MWYLQLIHNYFVFFNILLTTKCPSIETEAEAMGLKILLKESM